jgi:predicted nuclease of predicted toxin-antitoxin system
MRFLVDQGIGRGAVAVLRAAGHEADHVGALGMERAEDRAILARALATGAVVVTHDADFHPELARTGASGPSTVRFRYDGLPAASLARQLVAIAAELAEDLEAGALITVVRQRVRVRRLPLVR